MEVEWKGEGRASSNFADSGAFPSLLGCWSDCPAPQKLTGATKLFPFEKLAHLLVMEVERKRIGNGRGWKGKRKGKGMEGRWEGKGKGKGSGMERQGNGREEEWKWSGRGREELHQTLRIQGLSQVCLDVCPIARHPKICPKLKFSRRTPGLYTGPASRFEHVVPKTALWTLAT